MKVNLLCRGKHIRNRKLGFISDAQNVLEKGVTIFTGGNFKI